MGPSLPGPGPGPGSVPEDADFEAPPSPGSRVSSTQPTFASALPALIREGQLSCHLLQEACPVATSAHACVIQYQPSARRATPGVSWLRCEAELMQEASHAPRLCLSCSPHHEGPGGAGRRAQSAALTSDRSRPGSPDGGPPPHLKHSSGSSWPAGGLKSGQGAGGAGGEVSALVPGSHSVPMWPFLSRALFPPPTEAWLQRASSDPEAQGWGAWSRAEKTPLGAGGGGREAEETVEAQAEDEGDTGFLPSLLEREGLAEGSVPDQVTGRRAWRRLVGGRLGGLDGCGPAPGTGRAMVPLPERGCREPPAPRPERAGPLWPGGDFVCLLVARGLQGLLCRAESMQGLLFALWGAPSVTLRTGRVRPAPLPPSRGAWGPPASGSAWTCAGRSWRPSG